MMSKKISFVFLFALPFAASAETTLYYVDALTSTSVVTYPWKTGDFSDDEALRLTACRLSTRYSSSTYRFSFSPRQNTALVATNHVTGFTVTPGSNPYRLLYMERVNQITAFAVTNNLTSFLKPLTTDFEHAGNVYVDNFDPLAYVDYFLMSIPFEQRARLLSSLVDIKNDVSALVPLVESNKNINAGIALDFKSAITNAHCQRSQIINDLSTVNRLLDYTIDFQLSPIRDDLRSLLDVDPRVATSDNEALVLEYFDLMGFDYSNDYSALVQAMINSGLATNNNDALGKLTSKTWRRNTLGPYVQAQRKKRDLIAQLRQSGITHNFDGRALDALANPELETLLQYSFNTPASSNATLLASAQHSLDYIDVQTADAAIHLNDIKQKFLNGPLEVNVMNWPDDWLANSVSNALDGVFSGFLDGITNFNPHYNFDDTDFFSRNLYNWRGFGLSSLDQSEQNPVEPDEFIGVTTFSFSPTGDYFQDVPNLLAMQAMQGADLANIFASVAIHIQSNAVESANTDAEIEQYKEDLAEMANSALSEFEGLLHYSNLLENVEFTDTKDILSLPDGFRTFEGDWEIPEYVNIQMPTWSFQDPSEEHRRSGENPQQGYTLTIDTAQYRQFFQNVRYVSLTLYWALGVLVIFFLFRLFKAFVSWIPAGLTGEVPHDYSL